ncbi:multivesicular body subunit 12Ba isoform X4 [Ictalurus punctatus]|nr:multivesicular body subunit 12Ba isoform X4 [Ictalurus punctatus]
MDADLWKDGLFKSKVTRYLCFTRVFSKENSHLGNVLVDMKLIDIKDTLPVGFIPIQETVDTQEPAFRKRRLCIKFIPRDSTEAAICDIRILGRSKQAPPQYTFIGELNNMGIWYRMGKVPRTQDCSPMQNNASTTAATTSMQTVTNSTSVPVLPKHISMTLPASFRRSTTRPDYEHQSSNLYAISAMDGVPFVISEKFACASSEVVGSDPSPDSCDEFLNFFVSKIEVISSFIMPSRFDPLEDSTPLRYLTNFQPVMDILEGTPDYSSQLPLHHTASSHDHRHLILVHLTSTYVYIATVCTALLVLRLSFLAVISVFGFMVFVNV